MFCEDAFLCGPGVHVGPRFERSGKMLAKRVLQPVQAIPKHLVIIASPGVPGNPPTGLLLIVLLCGFRGKWMCSVVVEQTDDNAAAPRQGALRVGSPWVPQILHLAPVSASEPVRGLRQFWKFFRADHPAAVETDGFRPFHNPLRIPDVIHTAAASSGRLCCRQG